MQYNIEKYGFTYCGIIYLPNGNARLAYQKNDIGKPHSTHSVSEQCVITQQTRVFCNCVYILF